MKVDTAITPAGSRAGDAVLTAPARTKRTTPPTPFLYRRSGMLITRVATLVLVLAVWEWYAADKSIALLAAPSKVAQALYRMVIVDRSIIEPLFGSIGTMVIGLGLAIPTGILLGIVMGRYYTVENVLDPYVTFLYVLPNVAFLPILVVIFGINIQLRYALIFLSAVFPILINTMAGVKHVDRQLLESGRSFCATELQIVRTIVLPACIPFIFAGLRIGFSAAWVGAIVAEMTATTTGMGGLLLQAASRFRTADVFVAILGIMAIAVATQWLTSRLEVWLTPWRRGMTGHP